MKSAPLVAFATLALLLAGCTASPPKPQDSIESAAMEAPEAGNASTPAADEAIPTVPWTRQGAIAVGWVAAVGTAGYPEPQGVQDGSHCPSANFTVPEGAALLSIVMEAEHVSASRPGAGTYTLVLTDPSGRKSYYDPVLSGIPPESDQSKVEKEDPEPGEWLMEMHPIGPVVNQVWGVTVSMEGESPFAPSGDWAPLIGCE
ncbi:MAG TPA: hypothetical protein VNZ52_08365 [Candidatus Thermoplasmatota archaeon]|nr:hypothetical protein [Candidatus Thermoplasmatota archaeon]